MEFTIYDFGLAIDVPREAQGARNGDWIVPSLGWLAGRSSGLAPFRCLPIARILSYPFARAEEAWGREARRGFDSERKMCVTLEADDYGMLVPNAPTPSAFGTPRAGRKRPPQMRRQNED
jgi:hypothetical protein